MKPQLLIDLEKNAKEITDYYKEFSKDGIGAGEFISMAASWNYDGVTRPFQRKIIEVK
jgi:hypothetical protein